MKIYSHSNYDRLVQQTVDTIRELSNLKGGEYAGDIDRLANFRRNAKALGLANEQIWAVYAAKHWDAVMQYIKDLGENKERKRLESIAGRADDLIVYLILFKAILEDRVNESMRTNTSSYTVPEHSDTVLPERAYGYGNSVHSLCIG